MNIGIIDADLIGRKKHRFPNLACMKIAGFHRDRGDSVKLLLEYSDLDKYDKVYISKVFTDTYVDEDVLKRSNVEYGGTGFFYDKAPNLPYEIEHHMPYYDLYKEWVDNKLKTGTSRKELAYYLDYSIGFTTRGCFRKCSFCVNKNSSKVEKHSPLNEFVDNDRPYICLLDDNILGFPKYGEIFESLNNSGKRFQYKQGMDERILNDKKCEIISRSKLIGEIYFAFDNIEDKDTIIEKMNIMRKYTNKVFSFYVLCAFDRNNKYDIDFWEQDIIDTFERIEVLKQLNCKPYIMRYEKYKDSPFYGIYVALASWCNQPQFFKKMTFKEFCIKKGMNNKVYNEYKNNPSKYLEDGYRKGSTWKSLELFESQYSYISSKYFGEFYEKDNVKLGELEVEQLKWII